MHNSSPFLISKPVEMNIKDVFILDEAVADLEDGELFYDHQQSGVGNYFWDSIIADIESLIMYAGIHKAEMIRPDKTLFSLLFSRYMA